MKTGFKIFEIVLASISFFLGIGVFLYMIAGFFILGIGSSATSSLIGLLALLYMDEETLKTFGDILVVEQYFIPYSIFYIAIYMIGLFTLIMQIISFVKKDKNKAKFLKYTMITSGYYLGTLQFLLAFNSLPSTFGFPLALPILVDVLVPLTFNIVIIAIEKFMESNIKSGIIKTLGLIAYPLLLGSFLYVLLYTGNYLLILVNDTDNLFSYAISSIFASIMMVVGFVLYLFMVSDNSVNEFEKKTINVQSILMLLFFIPAFALPNDLKFLNQYDLFYLYLLVTSLVVAFVLNIVIVILNHKEKIDDTDKELTKKDIVLINK